MTSPDKPAKPPKTAPDAAAARRIRQDELEALRAELDSRIAEAEWLKAHYDEQLRSAFAQIASLQARLRDVNAAPPAAAVDPEAVVQLRAEIERLAAGEERYLDRIEELKEAARLGR